MFDVRLLLINLVTIHATKDLILHRNIVKGNSLLTILESKWARFCSWAHSQRGLALILWSLSLLYFPFAHFSSVFSGNSSWSGLWISEWCLGDCQCTPCQEGVQQLHLGMCQ